MSEQGTALEQRPDAPLAERDTSRAASALAELEEMRYFIQKQMQEDLDFGKIPGTGSKPTLLKPGAQKVAMYFNARPTYEWSTRELGEGHVEHVVTASLIHRATGEVIGEGLGSCTTMETKYRFRAASRVCPSCGSDALRKSKRDPEYYCWTKIGGCGATFGENDPAITSQPLGRAENDNIWDTRNTVLKMAEKRAFIDATVGLACLSQFFTQDLDDFQGFPEAAQTGPAHEAPSASAQTEVRASKASPYKPASANQLATIAQLSRLLGYPDEDWPQMTSAEASERITKLSWEYQERKGAAHVATERVQTTQEPAEAHALAPILGERVQALIRATGETKEGIMSRVCDLEGLRRNGRIDFSTFGDEEYQRLITRVEREIESAQAETSETDADVAQMLPF